MLNFRVNEFVYTSQKHSKLSVRGIPRFLNGFYWVQTISNIVKHAKTEYQGTNIFTF